MAMTATQGKHEVADSLYQRAIAIEENASGPDHPHLAVTLNNRANVLQEQVREYTGHTLLFVSETLPFSATTTGSVQSIVATSTAFTRQLGLFRTA